MWAGILGASSGTPAGRLCAIRSGSAQCYGEDGAFGSFVWSLYEDSSGTLWAGAESGLWRWKPGPPRRYATPGMRINDLSQDRRRTGVDCHAAAQDSSRSPVTNSNRIRFETPINPNRLLPDRDVNSNKLLRDRDGGLWIGTMDRGLIHVHHGRTDVFTKSDGLSGDIISSLFEDREGNIWVATTGGLDRFRELPVTTISAKQGLSSDATQSVLAATDGSIWVATHDGLTRWKNGQTTIFRKASGLPDDMAQSLFQDDRGRIWVFTGHGLAYFKDDRFVAVNGVPSEEVIPSRGTRRAIFGFQRNRGLSHMRDGRLVEHFPWSALGRQQQAKVVSLTKAGFGFHSGATGACCISRMVRSARRTQPLMGWARDTSPVFDSIATGRCGPRQRRAASAGSKMAASLRSRAGMVCPATRFTGRWRTTIVRCGCTRPAAWCASRGPNWTRGSPTRSVGLKPRFGMRRTASGSARFRLPPTVLPSRSPPMANCGSVTGEGIQVVDPRHLAFNKLPPPVHIEQVVADHKIYWQNLSGAAVSNVHLPPRTRDLQIDYIALSLVAPEKVHFRVQAGGPGPRLERSVNPRHAHYTNLPPRKYRFRVIACNNSGVWNEEGDIAGVLRRAGVLPDELVPSRFGGDPRAAAMDRLPRTRRGHRATPGRDHRPQRTADESAGAGADAHRGRAPRRRHAADQRGRAAARHGEAPHEGRPRRQGRRGERPAETHRARQRSAPAVARSASQRPQGNRPARGPARVLRRVQPGARASR